MVDLVVTKKTHSCNASDKLSYCFVCLAIFFDPMITSCLYSIYLKESFGLDAAAPKASPPIGQGHTRKVL